MNPDRQIEQIRDDADRLASCAQEHALSAPVAACPGWDLGELVAHVGTIHRWATHAVRHAAPPERGDVSGPAADLSGDQLGVWLRSGAADLIDALGAAAPDADTWHPFPVERKAWVWIRRQMMETAIHRWDGEVAAIGMSDLAPQLAAVGIEEFFDLVLPRIFVRETTEVPASSLHVHCTDEALPIGSGEWIAWNDSGNYRVAREHRKGDAALRGTAADILLVLMDRGDRNILDIVGDPHAAAEWLDLPGL